MASGILFGLFVAALIWVVVRNPSGEAVTLRPVPTDKPIVVHVSGAVPRPGVYALPQGARIQDAISAAGGFLVAGPSAANGTSPTPRQRKAIVGTRPSMMWLMRCSNRISMPTISLLRIFCV